MNLLIDTNVILDVLLKREPFYDDAARISLLSEKGYVRNYVSASAVTDIFYILKKKLRSRDAAFELLRIILKTTRIASVTADSIYEALDLKWSDFEDSVQYVIGKHIPADYIISRNPRDFIGSQIRVMTPGDFLCQVMFGG